jgi:hypothetical protein
MCIFASGPKVGQMDRLDHILNLAKLRTKELRNRNIEKMVLGHVVERHEVERTKILSKLLWKN